MFKNRLFNVLVIAALVVVTALTIQQALETTRVVSAASGSSDETYCFSGMERLSLTSVYIRKIGSWFSRTDSGFTGFEGGLIHLLSSQRACSK